MNKLDLLYDVLIDKIWSQTFYNEQMLLMVNPVARELFMRLRDEETQHVLVLRTEIIAMEANPFAPTKILPGLETRPRFRL
ncbi:hypothetical protein [Desulfofundulus salinus]|uniref:Rubrerythrin diiron-binding domain-containing protein n=1 Tax=Desulfofundulus salinus TaxID=2419843 RepID=A0A494WX38_9FIRM|nr:hypothetical protein [Desulfofundulus salinum]RKO68099.1 hypothetical protein D7024_05945 [Desulfofundulus salinum]